MPNSAALEESSLRQPASGLITAFWQSQAYITIPDPASMQLECRCGPNGANQWPCLQNEVWLSIGWCAYLPECQLGLMRGAKFSGVSWASAEPTAYQLWGASELKLTCLTA